MKTIYGDEIMRQAWYSKKTLCSPIFDPCNMKHWHLNRSMYLRQNLKNNEDKAIYKNNVEYFRITPSKTMYFKLN